MSTEEARFDLDSADDASDPVRGGFVALAIIAAGIGAGAALLLAPDTGAGTRERVGRGLRNIRGEAVDTIGQLQRELRRRRHQARREKRLIGLAGFLLGAGVAAILNPQSGPATRERLGSTLGRIKVGAVGRIRRKSDTGSDANPESQPVRSVQELGRDPDSVF
jgi:hypothetical protein